MRTRLLPFSEWHRLADTEIPSTVWMAHDKASLQFVVVEDDDGRIIATWATLMCRHVECYWTHPDYRGNLGTMRALFVGMREVLDVLRATTVVTVAETPEIEQLLVDAGATRVPGTMFLLPVDFGPWRRKDT